MKTTHTPVVPTKLPCAVYTRVSVVRERDKNMLCSTISHAERCKAYVTSREDLELVETYEDADESAGTLDRPGLQRLLRDVDDGKIKAVVVLRLDRLSRNIRDFLDLVERFEKIGCRLIGVDQSLDTSSAHGRLMVNILLAMAAWERETASERTTAKMLDRAKKGLWNGGNAPYGYAVVEKRLVPHEQEAEAYRTLVVTYLRTKSLAKTRDHLTKVGFRARNGEPFSITSIETILKNPLYSGVVRFHEHEFPGQHQALIAAEQYDEVRRVVGKNNHRPARQDRRIYVLRGLLHCTHCNAALTPYPTMRPGGREFPYYRCTHRRRNGVACPLRSIPADQLERAILAEVESWALRPDSLTKLLTTAEKQAERTELEGTLARLQAAIEKAKAEVDRAGDLLLKEWDDPKRMEAIVLATTKRHFKKLEELEREYVQAEARLSVFRTHELELDTIRQALINLRPMMQVAGEKEKAQLLGLLIRRIELSPDGTARVLVYSDTPLRVGGSCDRSDWLPGADEDSTLRRRVVVPMFRERQRGCNATGCRRPRYGKGYCRAHYRRLMRGTLGKSLSPVRGTDGKFVAKR